MLKAFVDLSSGVFPDFLIAASREKRLVGSSIGEITSRRYAADL
jgi:hypothetical protein